MNQFMLHAAVASATGESRSTIERIGFCHKGANNFDQPTNDDPLAVIDCPCCGGTVVLAWNRNEPLPDEADCRRCETMFPYKFNEVYEIDLLDVAVAEPLPYTRAA